MNVGARIKELRQLAGFSVSHLAKRADLSQSYLSEIERGIKKPSVDALQRICDALGITLADFFAPAGQGAEPLSPELRRLLENARELSPEQLAALERMIQAFKR